MVKEKKGSTVSVGTVPKAKGRSLRKKATLSQAYQRAFADGSGAKRKLKLNDSEDDSSQGEVGSEDSVSPAILSAESGSPEVQRKKRTVKETELPVEGASSKEKEI